MSPGSNRIVDEARAAGMRLAVCSTSKKESVLSVMDLMGQERKSWFEHVLAGDVVSRKKPDPEVSLLALERLGLEAGECVVVEDSQIGQRAALAAGRGMQRMPSRPTGYQTALHNTMPSRSY